MAPSGPVPPALYDLIADRLAPAVLHRGPDELDRCSRDASTLFARPGLVVRPTEVGQIRELLRLANRHGFSITPRGAGTGLAGGAVPRPGGVVLDLSGLDRILSLEPENMVAVVEPGVVTARLREAAAAHGLFYPPDPASLKESTIGGNVATNAGGPACVKYGTTRHYVLGLEAVIPSGDLLSTGTCTRKGVVGYDLTQLLTGSEGTLAVITRITLKLIPLPRAVRGLCAVFPDLVRAMRAVSAVMTSGVTPSAVEFLDSRCLDLVGDMLPLPDRPATAALLLAEADGSATQADEDLGCIARVCQACDALDVRPAGDDGERKRLWEVRRQVSLRIHDRWPVYVPEDVALPLGGIAAFVDRLPDLETRFGVRIYAFGHAGDGNIHINITAGQDHDPVAVEACTRELLADVVARGGTISGEHGIGTAKSRYLDLELSPVSIGLQKSLKALFDPGRVLNPGKVFP